MRCAGIVTYNPDIDRLRENLRAITPQVSTVFICDNGSDNIKLVSELAYGEFTNVQVEALGENSGIAHALNCLLNSARDGGFEQIELLDQDSVATTGMVDELSRHSGECVGLVCPFILDRNRMSVEEYRGKQLPSTEQLVHAASHGAITSGSLVNVPAAFEAGGFDDDLFIDYVDFDFNERLLLHGYEIIKDNTVYLIHEKGKSERTWLKVPRRSSDGSMSWSPLYKLGYSPMRCYYQARNRIIYWKKYHRWTKNEGLVEIPLLMALSLLFENHRIAKLHAYAKGIKDGMAMHITEYGK